jgi:hypothetical protein
MTKKNAQKKENLTANRRNKDRNGKREFRQMDLPGAERSI